MGIVFQNIDFPFAEGIDSKTDPRLARKLSRCENRMFVGGTLQKRPGTTSPTTAIDTGGNQTAGAQVFAYGNELVRINGGTTYGLASAANEWVTKAGQSKICTVTNTRMVRSTTTQQEFDQATINGVTVIAWVGAGNTGIHIAVWDETSNTFYQTGQAALSSSGTGLAPKCCVVAHKVFVVWSDAVNHNINLSIVDTANPETAPVTTTVRTDYTANVSEYSGHRGMDAVSYGAGVVVAYTPTTANKDSITLIQLAADGTVSGSPAPTTLTGLTAPSNPGLNGIGGLALTSDSNSNLFLVYTEDQQNHTVNHGWYNVLNASFGTVLAQTSAGNGIALSIALVESSTGHITAFYSQQGAAAADVIYSAVLGTAGVVTSNAAITGAFNVRMVTNATMFSGVPVVGVVTSGSTADVQPTTCFMDTSGNLLGRVLVGLSDIKANARVSTPLALSGGTAFLVSERGRLTYSSATGTLTDVTAAGITRVLLTNASAATVQANRVGETTYVGGAVPRIYDGQNFVEGGFALVPEGLGVSFGGADGNLGTGQYQWRALYSWLDARGQLHRSAPSPAVTGTPTANQHAQVTIPSMPLSAKDLLPAGATVQIELYRTTSNGTVFYRQSQPSGTTYFNGNSAGSAVVITDTMSDANLQSGELLYTTGGVLDWLAPPAYSISCVHGTRLFIAGLENPYEVRFSNQAALNETLRFNEVFSIVVPEATGPVTALASLDDKLVIFTSLTFYVIAGDGPDLLGDNAYSTPFQPASADQGAKSWQGVCSFPGGVIFQGPQGFYLLDRALNTEYIGADVQQFSGYTVRSAICVPALKQVRFIVDLGSDLQGQMRGSWTTSNGGTCLVYDYHYGQWLAWTNYGGQSSCLWQGKFTRVRSDGAVFQEQSQAFTDAGATYGGVIETPWLKVAGIQGFQRVRSAILTGLFAGDFKLLWEVAYDYRGTGGNPTYNAEDALTFDATGQYQFGDTWQIKRQLRVQKCEAVKFRFTELSAPGAGMGLTAVSLEVGVKPGRFRLPASKTL